MQKLILFFAGIGILFFMVACQEDDSLDTTVDIPIDEEDDEIIEDEPPYDLLIQDLNLPTTPYNYANIQLPAFFNPPGAPNNDNTPTDNQISDWGATLGRVLFYDPNLSANNMVACASCHLQENGFTDPLQFSMGFEGGHTGRNSMSLSNSRYYAPGAFFWDQRAATLEEQVLMPIQDAVEMGMNLEDLEQKLALLPYYPDLFEKAFGSTEINSENIAKALAQFVRSMVSFSSRYDEGFASLNPPQNPINTDFPNFTALENLGKQLFFDPNGGNCAVCHGTQHFMPPAPFNNGLDQFYEDQGIGAVTGLTQDNGFFKVGSLRNIALTAPFMHDGRFETLEEVIEHYNSGVQNHPNLSPQLRAGGPNGPPRQLNLTETEKSALVAFLETLTDSEFMVDERWGSPF